MDTLHHSRKKVASFIRSHVLSFFTLRFLTIVVVGVALLVALSLAYVALSTRGNPIPDKHIREDKNTANLIVADVTELYPVKVKGIVVPHTTEEIVRAVKENDRVSIGGGRNSMGGQTASERAVQIDMREFNKVLSLSTTTKEITVQSGITWRDIQDYIDPYNLSVKIMQTYSNFTVGGSLSVNVHGRYVGLGPIILSVKGFTIVLADGSLIHATPQDHADIFYSAIGGLGGIGVITDVTLSLAENVSVERKPQLVTKEEYVHFFNTSVRDNPKVIFHNGDIYPPDFDHVRAVSWLETDKEPTTEDRLIPKRHDYWKERIAWVIMSEWPGGRWIRQYIIDPLLYSGEQPVHTRNYEASYDIAELEPKERTDTSYVLQEYFVPVEHFDEWIPKMKRVFDDNNVNVINVSIRHALPDSGAKLAWARKESFAFVVYYKQGTDQPSRDAVALWTKQMIAAVLTVDGTYYLPYQIHATDDQFHVAYPHAIEYFKIKRMYDPTDKFTNKLWDTYYGDEKLKEYEKRDAVLSVASTTEDYFRPYDNAYLSIPEWFIVYNSAEYARVLTSARSSHFNYFSAVKEYWSEYSQVRDLTRTSYNNNKDYISVLRVIGISYSAELIVKGIYENTVGRLAEYVAGDKVVYEEKVAAQMNRDYGVFIYDYPWYDFPYGSYLKTLWLKSDDAHLSVGQYIRKAERLVVLSFEIIIKVVYAKIIAFGTHQKFGVQDDIVYAVISRDGGITKELIHAPHYQPFTALLLNEMQKASQTRQDFKVLDISGNQKITLSFVCDEGCVVPQGLTELRRTKEMFYEGKVLLVKERVHVEVPVTSIFNFYKELQKQGDTIDHLYDY